MHSVNTAFLFFYLLLRGGVCSTASPKCAIRSGSPSQSRYLDALGTYIGRMFMLYFMVDRVGRDSAPFYLLPLEAGPESKGRKTCVSARLVNYSV